MSKKSLEEILEDYSTQDIIEAVGEDNLLDEIGIHNVTNYFDASDILDNIWYSDIETYYNTHLKEKDTEEEVDEEGSAKYAKYEKDCYDDPMYYLIGFCRCIKNDYISPGFHSYQIREMFNEFMDFNPEKFYENY